MLCVFLATIHPSDICTSVTEADTAGQQVGVAGNTGQGIHQYMPTGGHDQGAQLMIINP